MDNLGRNFETLLH